MKSRKILSTILCITFLMSYLSIGVSAATDTTITFKYDDFSNIENIKLNPSATQVMEGDKTAIRLTESSLFQRGSFYWGNYVSLANNRSFSTMFSFKMSDEGGIGPGDGITFIMNTNTTNLGATGGGMGYSGITNSVGVEFDTWDNGTASMYGDAGLKANHVAININGDITRPVAAISQDDIEALYGVPKGTYNFGNGRNNSNTNPAAGQDKTYYAWIDYDGTGKVLTVRVNANSNVRPEKAILTKEIDLATSTTLTTDKVYVGFGAGTGNAFSNQYIKSWYFNNDFMVTSIDPINNNYVEAPKITLSSNPSTNTDTSLINAVVKNSDGSLARGIPVKFSILSGPDARFTTPTDVITDNNGVATVFLDGSNSPKGTIIINGEIDPSKGGNNGTTTVTNFGKSTVNATISDSTISLKQNTTYNFTDSQFTDNFSSDISSIKIISLPNSQFGTFKNDGTNVAIGDVIPADKFNVLTFNSTSATGNTALKWQATSDNTSYSKTATIAFDILPNNTPVTSNMNVVTDINKEVSGKISATDSDNDTLIYTAKTIPTKGIVSVNPTTGDWTYTPNRDTTGNDSFVVEISDGIGGIAQSTVDLVINAIAPTTTPTVAPTTQPTTEPTTEPTVAPTATPIPAPSIPSNPISLQYPYAYLYGYGNSMGTVGAEDPIKRDEASALIYRLLKQNDKLNGFQAPANPTFSDINSSRWSYSAVEYMTSIGVFDASSLVVKPDAFISRGEVAKIIALSLHIAPDDTNQNSVAQFTDLDTSNPYYYYLKALYDAGQIRGTSDTTINPNGDLTRAEFVTIINRLINRDDLYNINNVRNPYPDLQSGKWYYNDIMRASFGFTDRPDDTGFFNIDPARKLPRERLN